MTIWQLRRIYRRTGLPSPLRLHWGAPLVLGLVVGLYLALLPSGKQWLFMPLLAFGSFLAYPLIRPSFLGIPDTVRCHETAWLYGPSRRRIALAYVSRTAFSGGLLGVGAFLPQYLGSHVVPQLLAGQLPEMGQFLEGQLLEMEKSVEDMVLHACLGVALVGWSAAASGCSSTTLLPPSFRFGRTFPQSLRAALGVFLAIGAASAPVAAALSWWGTLQASIVLAAMPLPLLYLFLLTSESFRALSLEESLPVKDTAPAAPRLLQLKHRSYGPVRAILWRQGPAAASGVFLALFGLGIVSSLFGLLWSSDFSLAILGPLLVFFAICSQFPFYDDRSKAEAVYSWGMDLSRQERLRLWFTMGTSAALCLLGLVSLAYWGEGRRSLATVACFWALAACLSLSRGSLRGNVFLAALAFALLPVFGLRQVPVSWVLPAFLLCVLAVGFVFRAAWRASSDEVRFKETIFR